MYYITHLFYSLILAVSLLGYAFLYRKKTTLPICFFPITVISGISVIMYLFGLIGFLSAGCCVVIMGGFLCLFTYYRQDYVKAILLDWSILFGVFAVIWLFVITRDTGLAHTDDFNHWYRICKAMNYDGTYPMTADISYYTYVPGTATWIYFLTRFIGFSVQNCFFSQSILNIACLLCFFTVLGNVKETKNKVIFVVTISLSSILLCCITYSTYELLVDTLVGLVPLTAMIILLSPCGRKETALPICLILSYAAIIKNSCFLFVIITYIVAVKKYDLLKKDRWRYLGLWVGIPFILYRLYFVRASVYYPNGAEAAQNMSFSRFSVLMQDKGLETILVVIKNYFLHIADIDNDKGVTVCYLWLIAFIIINAGIRTGMHLFSDKAQPIMCNLSDRIKKAIICGIAILVLYNIGLICTYVFSMSTNEALTLGSFFRYFGSVTIYLLGNGIYILLKEISLCEQPQCSLIALILLVVYTIGFFNHNYIWGYEKYCRNQGFSRSYYDGFVNNVKENYEYTDTSYLIIWSGNEDWYIRSVAGTWLRSTNIWAISSNDITNGLDENTLLHLSSYDNLVTFEDMSEPVSMLKDYLPIGEYHIGICPIG